MRPIEIVRTLILMAFALGCGRLYGQSAEQAGSPAPASGSRALPDHVRVSSSVIAKLLLKKVAPEYPEKARKKRIEGVVVLHGFISKSGDVTKLSVVSGDPLLATAAMDAVAQWKYRPYLLEGHPVEVETEFQVNFALRNN